VESISYSVKTAAGTRVGFGSTPATRTVLAAWVEALPGPWVGALEATVFTGWIYDFLQPFAVDLQVAHPSMLQAIACAKKKSGRLDADTICVLLPQCYIAPPETARDSCRTCIAPPARRARPSSRSPRPSRAASTANRCGDRRRWASACARNPT